MSMKYIAFENGVEHYLLNQMILHHFVGRYKGKVIIQAMAGIASCISSKTAVPTLFTI